ncbi:helix-turn-helix transcriptional regulator [Magnetovibrio sp. PR-2]|uniref:helix-turn-helix domain-containing protein n=1 Tax=Magnetovibrio sp. PR-2 TaxID=3120356 RepID=UPI002FCE2F2E
MKKFVETLKKALSAAEEPDEWNKLPHPIGAMAKLIWVYRRHQNGEAVSREIEKIDVHPLRWDEALMVLAGQHDWWKYSEIQAKELGTEIKCVLEQSVKDAPSIDLTTIVSNRIVSTPQEANMIIQRLLKRDRAQAQRSALDLGLTEALANWSNYKAHGFLMPEQLKAIRKSPPLNLTQEAMAREIGMTLRQYVKYEAGTTPIPDDKVERIRTLIEVKNKKGLNSSSYQATPKSASLTPISSGRFALWLSPSST